NGACPPRVSLRSARSWWPRRSDRTDEYRGKDRGQGERLQARLEIALPVLDPSHHVRSDEPTEISKRVDEADAGGGAGAAEKRRRQRPEGRRETVKASRGKREQSERHNRARRQRRRKESVRRNERARGHVPLALAGAIRMRRHGHHCDGGDRERNRRQ